MLINIEVNNNVEIRSLNDLFILGRLQEVGSIKVNKSEIARELGVDRRTVSKYIDGYSKCDTRKRGSKIDEYYDFIDKHAKEVWKNPKCKIRSKYER